MSLPFNPPKSTPTKGQIRDALQTLERIAHPVVDDLDAEDIARGYEPVEPETLTPAQAFVLVDAWREGVMMLNTALDRVEQLEEQIKKKDNKLWRPNSL